MFLAVEILYHRRLIIRRFNNRGFVPTSILCFLLKVGVCISLKMVKPLNRYYMQQVAVRWQSNPFVKMYQFCGYNYRPA